MYNTNNGKKRLSPVKIRRHGILFGGSGTQVKMEARTRVPAEVVTDK